MTVKVHLNGAVCDQEDARVSVFDRGFLYGDSVYEVMRTSGGRPVELLAHLGRLSRSAHALALDIPSRTELISAVEDTLEASGNPESYVRIVVTRGSGEVGLDTALADSSNLIGIVKDLTLPPEDSDENGVRIAIVGVQRTPKKSVDPSVKSGNYLNNILALQEAKRAGAYECLMCNAEGQVAEGSSSNIFCVKGGVLVTPPLHVGLLAGITRERVLRLANDVNVSTKEGTLWPDDIRNADEVFITSSIRGVVPVRDVDGKAIGTKAPGPITKRLMDSYAEFLGEVALGK